MTTHHPIGLYLSDVADRLKAGTLTADDVPKLMAVSDFMNNLPVSTDAEKLVTHCRKFITDNRISCSEAVYQSDQVILNAYEFIEEVCEIVGYHQDDV